MADKRMHVWLRIRTILKAVYLFNQAGSEKHEEARIHPEKASQLRAEAEELYDMRREFRNLLTGGPHVQDQSVSGNSAPIQITRIELPEKVERTVVWIIPTLVIFTIIVGACGTIMGMNLAKQHQQDEDFKAMKTQEWLVERRLMDAEALAILHGERKPSDSEYGPTGNMQRMKPKE